MSGLIYKDVLLAELLEKPNIRYSNLDLIHTIAEQPTVDAVPVVHGEWILVTNGRGGHECNKCHLYAPSFINGNENLTPYCPNCGAKMDATDIKEKDNE